MPDKKETTLNFYLQVRWQTILTTHFLITALYLCFFFIGNIWEALRFAYYTLQSSGNMLGLEFAFWGVLFEISVVVPFLASFYSIFLLPKIWHSRFHRGQKVLLTLLMLAVMPLFIIFTDTLARYTLETDALREFVHIYRITS